MGRRVDSLLARQTAGQTSAGIKPPRKTEAIDSDGSFLALGIRPVMLTLAIALGLLQFWTGRYEMNPDGVSYLDLSDAFLAGDWPRVINGYWSPLYPACLATARTLCQPSAFQEFTVVHLANFMIYLGALASFEFFLQRLIRYQSVAEARLTARNSSGLPYYAWLSIGYAMFVWSSLTMITTTLVTPDLLVAAFVYLVAAIMIEMRVRPKSWFQPIAMGIVLGLAYLAKAAMFPFAFVAILVNSLGLRKLQAGSRSGAITMAAFVAVGGFLLIPLSISMHHPTFGETGKLNYVWYVNQLGHNRHWQGEPKHAGIPLHPTRKLSEKPDVFEYAHPISGTYPPWSDPSYWHAGVKVSLSVRDQLGAVFHHAKDYYKIFTDLDLCISVIIILCLAQSFHSLIHRLRDYWFLIVPSLAVLGMYAVVHVESRFLGAFLTVLTLAFMACIRLPDASSSSMIFKPATYVLAFIFLVKTAIPIAQDAIKPRAGELQRAVADELPRLGLRPGDEVAFIGEPIYAYWARIARVRIVGEVPEWSVDDFWTASPDQKARVMDRFRATGVKAVIAEGGPILDGSVPWKSLGESGLKIALFEQDRIPPGPRLGPLRNR